MDDNILNTIKKLLGMSSDDSEFNTDVIVAINASMFVLEQLGVDFPYNVYTIDEDTEWSDLFDDTKLDLEAIKQYLYLKARQTVDPPSSSILADVIQQQIDQLEWRLNISAENRVE